MDRLKDTAHTMQDQLFSKRNLKDQFENSLRSWRYCKSTRNKVLAAETTSEQRSREENGEWDFEISRGFAARFWRLRRQNFISHAPTIPPATQAEIN